MSGASIVIPPVHSVLLCSAASSVHHHHMYDALSVVHDPHAGNRDVERCQGRRDAERYLRL